MLRRTASEHPKRCAPFTRRRQKGGGQSSRDRAPSRNEGDRSQVKRQIRGSISAIGRYCCKSLFASKRIWPNYEVGPHKIVFAVGVVSINFVCFERVINWMLAFCNSTRHGGLFVPCKALTTHKLNFLEDNDA